MLKREGLRWRQHQARLPARAMSDRALSEAKRSDFIRAGLANGRLEEASISGVCDLPAMTGRSQNYRIAHRERD
jgi:hypothetical protein